MIVIRILTDNAAFENGNKRSEVVRILKRLAAKIANEGIREQKLMDINGNSIGALQFEQE